MRNAHVVGASLGGFKIVPIKISGNRESDKRLLKSMKTICSDCDLWYGGLHNILVADGTGRVGFFFIHHALCFA